MVAIRPAQRVDVETINGIIRHYILNTVVTFDLEPHTIDQRMAWFEQFGRVGPHRCFVADDGGVLGWAASKPYRNKDAYNTTVETSVYVAPDAMGKGLGAKMYGALFESLADSGLHRAVAGITAPNPASEALHRKFGFQKVGTFGQVGFKHGRFWDVDWYERAL